MSIKNPYGKTYRSGIPGQGMQDNPRHDAFNEGVKAAVKYLGEPCYEHFPGRHRINTLYKDHRKDCDFCMAEVHKELGQ